MSAKIRSFSDLLAWREGHKLVLLVYNSLKDFPSNEKFGLVSQIGRAVVSITSNIAEGFSRSSKKEKIQFYRMALGSLTELQNQLVIARDLGYFNIENFNKLAEQSMIVSKLINGLIKSANDY